MGRILGEATLDSLLPVVWQQLRQSLRSVRQIFPQRIRDGESLHRPVRLQPADAIGQAPVAGCAAKRSQRRNRICAEILRMMLYAELSGAM